MLVDPIDRPLRICFVGWGDHVHLERWAGWFARAGQEVTIVSMSGEGRYPAGVRQHRVGLETRGPHWKSARLSWLLRRIRPDLVHVHWAPFASLVRPVWRGPLIVTAWGSDIYRRRLESSRSQEALRTALRAATVVTCDSADLAREIVEFSDVAPARVQVVQWGVDTDCFRPVAAPAFARELGVSGNRVVFSARNFLPLYNQETVVEAFERVHAEFPDATLLMKDYNGDVDYRRRVLDRVAALGLGDAVRVVGKVPHERMAELYSMAAVTVSVPSSDATPMALFEAMACGSVPVFSDLPSLREWIAEGRNGFLVPPGDAAILADRICSILRDPAGARHIAERNRDLVEARASQASNMRRMLSIYVDATAASEVRPAVSEGKH